MLPLVLLLVAQYDVVLKGGRVIDPKNNVDRVADIAIQNGKIAAVGENLTGTKSLDVKGLVVTPGLVDIHVHVFHTTGIHGAWAGDLSVRPDDVSFRTGVTSMADAGSSGWRNFEQFRQTVIDRAETRVFSFINIAGLGMITDITEQADFNPKEVARLAQKHRDVVVGVKSAHYEKPDWESVDSAIEAGNLAQIPVMVDFGYFYPERPYWKLVTEKLRPGDISTHMFRGPVPYVGPDGKLLDYLHRARQRGVKFDVGHGGGSFVFRNAAPAIAAGFYPDSVSTDLHVNSMNGAMMDMPTTMTKLLALGEPLLDVIRSSTWIPAQLIHHEEVGHLSIGAVADIAVWNLAQGDFGLADFAGGAIRGKQRLICELTLKDGKVKWDWNARGSSDWHKLPPTYGIRPVDKIVLPPR